MFLPTRMDDCRCGCSGQSRVVRVGNGLASQQPRNGEEIWLVGEHCSRRERIWLLQGRTWRDGHRHVLMSKIAFVLL